MYNMKLLFFYTDQMIGMSILQRDVVFMHLEVSHLQLQETTHMRATGNTRTGSSRGDRDVVRLGAGHSAAGH